MNIGAITSQPVSKFVKTSHARNSLRRAAVPVATRVRAPVVFAATCAVRGRSGCLASKFPVASRRAVQSASPKYTAVTGSNVLIHVSYSRVT